jgi:hypothetical protein
MSIECDPLPRAWRPGPGTVVLTASGILLILFLLICTGAWATSQQRLADELQRIRAAGEPCSVDEMEAYYQAPPADQDTTQLWLAGLAPLDATEFRGDAGSLPFVGDGSGEVPLPDEPWPQLGAAEHFLAQYQSSLDDFHEAARKGGRARFPTRFSDGLMMLLPHAQQIRSASRLLALETSVAAHRGRRDVAVESIMAMFAAERSLEQEPLVVSQLVRIALGSMARDRLLWLSSSVELSDEQVARFDVELTGNDYQQSMRRALVGMRFMGIQAFASPASMGTEGPRMGLALTRPSDERIYLEFMAQIVAAAGNNTWLDRHGAVSQAESQVMQLENHLAGKLRFPVTLWMAPSMRPSLEATSRAEANRDATRVVVAIERFRRAQGRLPSKLDELVPTYFASLPQDPFTGGSLQYRVDPDEYVVYSVGSNGVDDGGTSKPPGQLLDVVASVRIKPRK